MWYNELMAKDFEKTSSFSSDFVERWKAFWSKKQEQEPRGSSVGVCELSKAEVRGKAGESEDACFVDEEKQIFAVFDGAGGEEGARLASQTAARTLAEITRDESVEIQNFTDLTWALNRINRAVINEPDAGYSTGVIAKISEGEEGKELHFVSVGDSRLYLVHGDKIEQITTDDSVTETDLDRAGISDPVRRRAFLDHGIKRSLGPNFSVAYRNCGKRKVEGGDRLVLCSDGVTGDVEEDRMSEEEILGFLRENRDDEDAARELVRGARKVDDRTAIVVTV